MNIYPRLLRNKCQCRGNVPRKSNKKEQRQIRNPGHVYVYPLRPEIPKGPRDIGGGIKISVRFFRRDYRETDTSVLHRASLSGFRGGIPAGSWWHLSLPPPSAPEACLCRPLHRKFNRPVQRFRFHMKNFGMITPRLKLRTPEAGRSRGPPSGDSLSIDIHRGVSRSLISPGQFRAWLKGLKVNFARGTAG